MEHVPIILLAHIRQLVRLAKRVHEIRQTRLVQVDRVVLEQGTDELAEAEIEEERATVGP